MYFVLRKIQAMDGVYPSFSDENTAFNPLRTVSMNVEEVKQLYPPVLIHMSQKI